MPKEERFMINIWVVATTENIYWLLDGVHPTAMEHEIIKRERLK